MARNINWDYSADELKQIDWERRKILINIEELTHKNKIFPNQTKVAKEIIQNFADNCLVAQLIIGLTQSGKTGAMLATIQECIADQKSTIDPRNIYIITGLSSVEWVEQTKERLPSTISERVLHLNKINETSFNVKDKKNALIIIDESHIASLKNQTISKQFKDLGLLDKNYLFQNNIMFLEFSATPDGIVHDMKSWDIFHKIVMFEPGEGYTSCFDLMELSRLKECESLSDSKHLKAVKKEIDKFAEPLYHMFRLPSKITQRDAAVSAIKAVFSDKKYKFENYDESSEFEINNILAQKPAIHTIFFVKEKLRCAKTIAGQYIGILHERSSNDFSDSLVIQGFLGRLTGYNYNNKAICYTHIDSVKKYKQLWDSKFADLPDVKWKSNSTKTFKKKTVSRSTRMDPKNFTNWEQATEVKVESDEIKQAVFLSQADAEAYHKQRSNTQFKPKKISPDGFYRENRKIMTVDEAVAYGKSLLKSRKKQFTRYVVGYTQKTDPSSVNFVVIHSN